MQEKCESLIKCADNLFDELDFIKKQAINLCAFLSDMPAGEDKTHKRNEETRLTFDLVTTRSMSKRRLTKQKLLR